MQSEAKLKRHKQLDSALFHSFLDHQLSDKIGDDYIEKPQVMLDDSVGTLESHLESA